MRHWSAADVLLPNAQGEADSIRTGLGVTTPIRFVPNGVDPELFSPGQTPSTDRTTLLFVGRIEPHKNQLGLIEAVRGADIPLVIVGKPHPHHDDYYRRCIAEANDMVYFTGGIDYENLSKFYQQARVHVLPTWFETTGLVSLEAALSGCKVVSTSRGYAREYLGGLAWYCDPADPKSILTAVSEAWSAPYDPRLRDRVLESYTWGHCAQATLQAYEEVLDKRRSDN